jgi:hypothetical protein
MRFGVNGGRPRQFVENQTEDAPFSKGLFTAAT